MASDTVRENERVYGARGNRERTRGTKTAESSAQKAGVGADICGGRV